MTELPINKLLFGNAIKLIPMLPNKCIDLVATDPPYNISRDTVIRRKGGKYGMAKDINLDFGKWDHNIIKPKDWIPLIIPKLKPCGVFMSLYDKRRISNLCDLLEELEMFIRHVGVWHKKNPAPQARKVKWQNASELFVIATKNRGTGHHFNYEAGQHHDVITTPICLGKERLKNKEGNTLHPTQKPEALMFPIIKWWSFEGDIVLDPFCGTGTTCAVAKKLGRNHIGFDNNKEFLDRANIRLKAILGRLDVFFANKEGEK